jgi:DNA-binding XRE family transcriptional regulator
MRSELNSPFGKPLTEADKDAAKRLRQQWDKRRSELGLTQVSAAEKLGISQPSISKYLNGRIALGVKATLDWANLLHVSPTLDSSRLR